MTLNLEAASTRTGSRRSRPLRARTTTGKTSRTPLSRSRLPQRRGRKIWSSSRHSTSRSSCRRRRKQQHVDEPEDKTPPKGKTAAPIRRPPGDKISTDQKIVDLQNHATQRSVGQPHRPPAVAGQGEEGRPTYSSKAATISSPERHRRSLQLPYLHPGGRGTGSQPPPAAEATGGGREPRPRRRRKGIWDASLFRLCAL